MAFFFLIYMFYSDLFQKTCCINLQLIFYFIVIDAGNRLMSPACPFITEHLYQNLKRIRAPHALDGSIHYQMLPEVNDQLINVEIEEAVANMTNVIRLGRTIRDQKVKFLSFLDF